jgi:hypothetical protein
MSNILVAIKNVVENPVLNVRSLKTGRNRMNSVGEALESYVKDIFADSFQLEGVQWNKRISEVFSYTGNQNNPPDMILRNGDAIETKKIQTPNNDLALNSSYPKSKLFADSKMVNDTCRKSEDWTEKDLIYVVGHTGDEEVKYLWFVYGDCFVADKEIYERITNTISEGISNIPDVEFSITNELGRVTRVDPLGITALRIRGMWQITNPNRVFAYLNCYDKTAKFQVICLMKTEKFNSFSKKDRNELLGLKKENYAIEDVEIKNPNNPAQLLNAKLITYKVY